MQRGRGFARDEWTGFTRSTGPCDGRINRHLTAPTERVHLPSLPCRSGARWGPRAFRPGVLCNRRGGAMDLAFSVLPYLLTEGTPYVVFAGAGYLAWRFVRAYERRAIAPDRFDRTSSVCVCSRTPWMSSRAARIGRTSCSSSRRARWPATWPTRFATGRHQTPSSFRAEAEGRSRGIAIIQVEGPLYRESRDSSTRCRSLGMTRPLGMTSNTFRPRSAQRNFASCSANPQRSTTLIFATFKN